MFCDVYNSPLHLSNTLWERRLGLGSTLHIQCTNAVCDAVCQVDTGKRGSSGAFDVNSKAAIGMVHAGIGPSQVNNFLVECNIPPIATSTLKRKESLIGKTLVEAASTSCRDAQTEEKELSSEKVILLDMFSLSPFALHILSYMSQMVSSKCTFVTKFSAININNSPIEDSSLMCFMQITTPQQLQECFWTSQN
ncbi:uncharacterized protein LOC117315129 [Pecten maximus]|uniref:uncharacterized protein LOC117315129 n=1 Tax=Pecten maximus TaxID=6579 RepID=UPI00145815A2|nr:uncharacterized protein LOC117315129 [Pecten maximus]